jgi:aspartate--ammonia ligase
MEIVQSLAKWKRFALKSFNLNGLYTDMNAIRLDEIIDDTHALHVDQWDWEKVIDSNVYTGRPIDDMTMEEYISYTNAEILLKQTASKIYKAIRNVDRYLSDIIVNRKPLLSGVKNVSFITSEELRAKYPSLTPRGRERAIAKEKGIVFISQIGKKLSDNTVHGDRAKDYDNWEFNGDIVVWNPCTYDSLELSSMGIRVDADSLKYQYESSGINDIPKTAYHRMILNNELPKTIGGGIGQSRLFMWLLQLPSIEMVHPLLTVKCDAE